MVSPDCEAQEMMLQKVVQGSFTPLGLYIILYETPTLGE